METNNLATALAKAQSEMGIAEKSGRNPHFKSNYSTFEDLIKCSRQALSKNGLGFSQYAETIEDYDYLVSRLVHGASGEEIVAKTRIRLEDPENIQKFGSAMTYYKRYQLASICGIACGDEDDDGNSISHVIRSEPVKTYQKSTQTNERHSSQPNPQGPKENEAMTPNQYGLIRKHLKGETQREQEICQRIGTTSLETTSWKWVNSILVELGVEQPNKFYRPLPPLRRQATASGYAQETLKNLINNQSNISDVAVEAETEVEYEEVLPF